MSKPITYEEFKKIHEEKIRLEKYLEHLSRLLRAYINEQDSDRIKNRKEKKS